MARSKLRTKSLAGNLQFLTSAVLIVLITAFVSGFSYISSKMAHEERKETAQALGTTLARLVARPISLGDYLSVEQSLRGSSLQEFVCSIRVLTPNQLSVASIVHSTSKLCQNQAESITIRYPIVTAAALDPAGEREIGTVVLNLGLSDLKAAMYRNILAALVLGGALLIVLLILNRIAVDQALLPLARAVSAASDSSMGIAHDMNQARQALQVAPREIQPLLERLLNLSAEYAKADGDIRVAKVARQVAHDIRSPLAALEMSSASKNIPESERVIIRMATTRIRDIANDLTGRFREAPPSTETNQAVGNIAAAPQIIPTLIDEIVTEMRIRFRPRRGLEITANLDESNYGLFAAVEPAKFRRALSNLIQNAVEAIPENGRVEVVSVIRGDQAVIEVRDNGQGIPADILPRLGTRGETFGKPQGSGLGLYSAKQMAESFGGQLEIESERGKGTTIRITLPLAAAPAWFVPRLDLSYGAHVVVVDDDQSIHQVWNERLAKWAEAGALKLIHFTSGDEFRAWFKANENLARSSRYLVDYELIGEQNTGISLVEELGIQDRSILITSHYDEAAVQAACERNQVRLIPKGLAVFVPVHVENRAIRAILIDDDALTHRIWNHVAEHAGRRILTLFTDAELDTEPVALDTPIYVDRNLANGASGEDVLKRLHGRGFSSLYLFTGDAVKKGDFPELSFIRDVVGKTVPPEVYGGV